MIDWPGGNAHHAYPGCNVFIRVEPVFDPSAKYVTDCGKSVLIKSWSPADNWMSNVNVGLPGIDVFDMDGLRHGPVIVNNG